MNHVITGEAVFVLDAVTDDAVHALPARVEEGEVLRVVEHGARAVGNGIHVLAAGIQRVDVGFQIGQGGGGIAVQAAQHIALHLLHAAHGVLLHGAGGKVGGDAGGEQDGRRDDDAAQGDELGAQWDIIERPDKTATLVFGIDPAEGLVGGAQGQEPYQRQLDHQTFVVLDPSDGFEGHRRLSAQARLRLRQRAVGTPDPLPVEVLPLRQQLPGGPGVDAELLGGGGLVVVRELPRRLQLLDVAFQAVEHAVGIVARIAGRVEGLEQRDAAPPLAAAHRVHEVEDHRVVVRRADGVHVGLRRLFSAAVLLQFLQLPLDPLRAARVCPAALKQMLRHRAAQVEVLRLRAVPHPAGHLPLLGQVEDEHLADPGDRLVQGVGLAEPLRLERDAGVGHGVLEAGGQLPALRLLETIHALHEDHADPERETRRRDRLERLLQRRGGGGAVDCDDRQVEVAAVVLDDPHPQPLHSLAHLGPIGADDEVGGLEGIRRGHRAVRIARGYDGAGRLRHPILRGRAPADDHSRGAGR
ncbi:MAG: hypothetical protein BWY94_01885 [Actinobacteria bacterium ADurb.BinA094]|nr:MAG: hypothetical protein BWY94_01885 [Actinobacteria bacterium ADurb.BinA094]